MYPTYGNYNTSSSSGSNGKQIATGNPSNMYTQAPIRPGSGQGYNLSSPAPAPPALASRIMGNASMNIPSPLTFPPNHLMQQPQQQLHQGFDTQQQQPQRYQNPQHLNLQQQHHHQQQQQQHHYHQQQQHHQQQQQQQQQQHHQQQQQHHHQQIQQKDVESIQDPQPSDTKKRRGRPKKLIYDPEINDYIDSTHPNYKSLNRILKNSNKSSAASTPAPPPPAPAPAPVSVAPTAVDPEYESEEVRHARKLARLQDKPPYLRSLEDETVQRLIKKKDKRGRPRKFPVEQTGVTIKGIRVNGTPGAMPIKRNEIIDPSSSKITKDRSSRKDDDDINATIQSVIPSHLQRGP